MPFSCSNNTADVMQNTPSAKARHAQEPPTPKNPGVNQNPIPQQSRHLGRQTNAEHSAHTQNTLHAMPRPATRTAQLHTMPHQGQTPIAKPDTDLPTQALNPSHSNEQPGQNPTETSRAHRAHQNLIHNQQRTRPDTAAPKHQAATQQPLPNRSEPHATTQFTKPYPLCRQTMEMDGIEPTTSCLQSRRSPN